MEQLIYVNEFFFDKWITLNVIRLRSYRLEHLNDNISSVSNSEKDHIIHKRIINAVDIHRRALELVFHVSKRKV